MAKGKTETVTQIFKDNASTPITVVKVVEQVVVDGKLVPDHREIRPGVIIGNPNLK